MSKRRVSAAGGFKASLYGYYVNLHRCYGAARASVAVCILPVSYHFQHVGVSSIIGSESWYDPLNQTPVSDIAHVLLKAFTVF